MEQGTWNGKIGNSVGDQQLLCAKKLRPIHAATNAAKTGRFADKKSDQSQAPF